MCKEQHYATHGVDFHVAAMILQLLLPLLFIQAVVVTVVGLIVETLKERSVRNKDD